MSGFLNYALTEQLQALCLTIELPDVNLGNTTQTIFKEKIKYVASAVFFFFIHQLFFVIINIFSFHESQGCEKKSFFAEKM